MALPEEIAIVRRNTNEPNDVDPYTDTYINDLIDFSGVTGATLQIWQEKAATHASLVDVTEAGASHKLSDMFKSDQAMVKYWGTVLAAELGPTVSTFGPKVKKIVRL